MINKLIEQIGRERLEQYAFDKRMCNINEEIRLMARALLAVLDAKPVGVVEEITDGPVLDGVIHTEPRTMKSIKGLLAMKRQPVGTKFYTTPPAASAPEWVKCSEQMPPVKTAIIVGKWNGRLWATKWATYIPSHPEANSFGYLMPGGSWEPDFWMPLPAAPAPGGE